MTLRAALHHKTLLCTYIVHGPLVGLQLYNKSAPRCGLRIVKVKEQDRKPENPLVHLT